MKDINPAVCVGYANILLASGTNDLRTEYINNKSQIHQVVDCLRHKVTQIKQLCPTSKITVMPVLPTRLPEMNRNISLYNYTVDVMLHECFPEVWFPSVHNFLDETSLLSVGLTRANDSIHLGNRGIAKFVSTMKQCVYKRECESRVKSSNRNQRPAPAPW